MGPVGGADDQAGIPPEGVRSPARVPTNLHHPLTAFIGRHAELELAGGLLANHRLVTVTGPGGAGKTRMAARVAAERGDRNPDGV